MPFLTCDICRRGGEMITITKKDLIELGYGDSFATDIIRKAKQKMVEKGFDFYQSRKLNRVPFDVVEEILGITLPIEPHNNPDNGNEV